jgi:hypothetical protein
MSLPSGTPRYMSPELHAPEQFGLTHCRPAKPADIYAFAFLVLEVSFPFASRWRLLTPSHQLHTLRPPFQDLKDTAVALKVLQGDRPPRPSLEECRGLEITSPLWDTIQACWAQDVLRRPPIARIAAAARRSWDLVDPGTSRSLTRLPPVAPLSPKKPATTPRKPTLEELRGKLLKISLPDGSHHTRIDVSRYNTGLEVLETALRKLGKPLPRGGEGTLQADAVPSENDGLTISGWGIYWDKPGNSGYGGTPQGPLTEAQLLSICHTDANNPVREQGLMLMTRASPYRSHVARRADSSTELVSSPASAASPLVPGRKSAARSVDNLPSHRAPDHDPKSTPTKSHRRAETADSVQSTNAIALSRNMASALPFSPLKPKTSTPMLGPRIMVRSPTLETNLDPIESGVTSSRATRPQMHIETVLKQGVSGRPSTSAAKKSISEHGARRGLPLTPLVIDDTVFPRPRNPPAEPSAAKQLPSLPPPSGGRSNPASPVTPEPMRNSRPATDDVYARLDTFFPKHNLDDPVIDPLVPGPSPASEAPIRPVTPTSSKFRPRKSIRVVAAEGKRKLDNASEQRQALATATKKAQKRTTKMWGSKVQEVVPASSLNDKEDIPTPLSSSKCEQISSMGGLH